MRCLLILLTVYVVVAVAERIPLFQPDYTYYANIKGWFKYHVTPATWYDARLRCESEGASLASPVNKVLLDFLKPRIGDGVIFTGIHSTYSPGNFTTIEGLPLSEFEHNWAPDEPDNYENKESCIAMLQDGTLSDVNCNQTLPYLCYKGEFAVPYYKGKCDTNDEEYVFKSETGSCYKFHKFTANWHEARNTCRKERARLAIINSDEESNVLKQMYLDAAKDLKPSFVDQIGTYEYDFAYVLIGFTKLSDRDYTIQRIWKTVEGQTLEAAGFSTFAEREPSRRTGSCGSFRGDSGKLSDIDCDGTWAPYMCEKEPKKDIKWL